MKPMFFCAITAAMITVGATTASASLTLVQSSEPAGTSMLFEAIGTKNQGNQKARLEAAGQSIVQGGNPGNGWWNDIVRSWELVWDSTAQSITFNVFASSDWSGAAAMQMTQNPLFNPGESLIGLRIGARLTSDSHVLTLANMQFDGGSGFVAVPTADAVYSGNAWFENYHSINGALGNGPLGDFTLRGTTLMEGPNVTSDGFRFFVKGLQGAPIPAPGVLAMLGVAGLIGSRRRA